METDWLARGVGFVTDPDGVVTALTRANRAQLLPEIESRQDMRAELAALVTEVFEVAEQAGMKLIVELATGFPSGYVNGDGEWVILRTGV
jgi:sugar phosphate isomerase/epimerase